MRTCSGLLIEFSYVVVPDLGAQSSHLSHTQRIPQLSDYPSSNIQDTMSDRVMHRRRVDVERIVYHLHALYLSSVWQSRSVIGRFLSLLMLTLEKWHTRVPGQGSHEAFESASNGTSRIAAAW